MQRAQRAYAADGYNRLNGVCTLIVTNGVGALSAINGVAGADSEQIAVGSGRTPRTPDRSYISLPRDLLERDRLGYRRFGDEGRRTVS